MLGVVMEWSYIETVTLGVVVEWSDTETITGTYIGWCCNGMVSV